MGSVLKPLVTVELQLSSDHFFFFSCVNSIQYQINGLFRSHLISNDAFIE